MTSGLERKSKITCSQPYSNMIERNAIFRAVVELKYTDSQRHLFIYLEPFPAFTTLAGELYSSSISPD